MDGYRINDYFFASKLVVVHTILCFLYASMARLIFRAVYTVPTDACPIDVPLASVLVLELGNRGDVLVNKALLLFFLFFGTFQLFYYIGMSYISLSQPFLKVILNLL